MDDITLELALEIDKALKPLNDLTKSVKKTEKQVGVLSRSFKLAGRAIKGSFGGALGVIKSLSSSLFSVKGLVVGIGAAFAGGALIGGLKNLTDAASVQEDAINSLNTALKTSGEFSEEASRDLQDYASSIQQSTKFGDELVIQQLALAKAFGATNDQAKDVVTAATELAAATGKSLDEATRQVSKTLGGFAGELGEVNPAIKALTAEQLQAGDAARILIEQYGGSAAAQINTFSGAVGQTSNTFGDLLESLGAVITQNPVVIEAIKGLNGIFEDLISFVTENESAIRSFVADAVRGLVRGFSGLVGTVSGATKSIANFILTALNISVIGDVVKNLGNGFKLIGVIGAAAFENVFAALAKIVEVAALIPGVGDTFQPAIDALKVFEAVAKDVGDELDQSIAQSNPDNSGLIESLTEIATAADTVETKVTDVVDNLANKLDKVQSEPIKVEVSANLNNQNNVGKSISDEFLETTSKNASSIFASVASGLFEGSSNGVAKLFTEGASAAVDVFAPGFGQAAKPLFDALAKGPEFVKTTIEGFVAGIPEILDNIAQALPVLFETIADNSDEIVIAIAKAAPALARAIAIEVPLALSRPAVWRDVAVSLVEEIAREITGNDLLSFDGEKLNQVLNEFLGKLDFGLNKFITDLSKPFQPLINALDNLAASFPSASGSGARGFFSDPAGSVSRGINDIASGRSPFALGGTVPQGFPDDSFPASLTSGEVVIPRDDVRELRSFLASQRTANSDMSETNALLAIIAQNMSGGQNVNITLNGDALAENLLQLDRNNERLTA